MNNLIIVISLFISCLSCTPNRHRLHSYHLPTTKLPYTNQFSPIINNHSNDYIDFLHAHERGPRIDRLFSDGAKINRTKGFNYNDFQDHIDLNMLRNPPQKATRITWLGHASFLIQFSNGLTVLTDPVFGELPFHSILKTLKRISPSIVHATDLDFIDIVVISHNHYDHLSLKTLKDLNKTNSDTTYLVPLGDETRFARQFKNVIGMDWHASKQFKSLNITYLPSQHWSRHGLWDENMSLWGGWLFQFAKESIYFSGDTGYSQLFKHINTRYGNFTTCLLPIVSYKPIEYRENHISPEDALTLSHDVGCTNFIPWGYGTFTLGHEHILEPLRRLKHSFQTSKSKINLHVLKMGSSFTR